MADTRNVQPLLSQNSSPIDPIDLKIIDLKLNNSASVSQKEVGRSSSLVRTLALRAKGRRFKSGPAHQDCLLHDDSQLFSVETCENYVVSCFKWVSNVFERLKPNSRDFSISSLSRYKTTFLLFDICIRTRAGARGSSLL